MLCRNRLLYAAIKGCVAATLLWPLALASQEYSKSDQPAKSNATQERVIVVPNTDALRAIFDDAVKAYRDEKGAGEDGERRREEREKADIIAQQDMARWALIMWIIAAIQLPLSAATLWFLFQTFKENRRTANAAIRAAEAAVASERARFYIQPAHHELQEIVQTAEKYNDVPDRSMPNHLRISYAYKNFGKTPAIIREIWHGFEIAQTPENLVYSLYPHLEGEVTAEGGVTDWIECVGHHQIVAVSDAMRVWRGETTIWFFARICYVDVFDQSHEARFLYRFVKLGESFALQPYDYKHYNRST